MRRRIIPPAIAMPRIHKSGITELEIINGSTAANVANANIDIVHSIIDAWLISILALEIRIEYNL